MPRKGSRRAEIGNHLYLWRVKKTEAPREHGRGRGLYFLLLVQRDVEHFSRPGSVATFVLESRSSFFKMAPWGRQKPGTNVSRTDVCELVRFALEQGWDPEDQDGPPFWVPPEDAPDLTKFNVARAS